MNPDNRSSFYGGEKPPTHQAQQSQSTGARISTYSAFNNNAPPPGTAGYNRNSFFFAGREEPLKGGDDDDEDPADAFSPTEPVFDIYADFNNAGPKYSAAFVPSSTTNSNGYQQLPKAEGSARDSRADLASNAGGQQVEMVTVPALGPEWGKEELKDMTKSAKRASKMEQRKSAIKSWNRGERGMCGKYFTKRVFVWFMFILCCCIGLVLAFVIPRVPSFSFNGVDPLAEASGSFNTSVPTEFSRSPANFSFPAYLVLQANTQSNFLPVHFTHIYATVYDLETDMKVGTGDLVITLPAKAYPDVQVPVKFSYSAANDSDITWNEWYDACRNAEAATDGERSALMFRMELEMHIRGLPSTYITTASVNDAECPITLPLDSA
ncbi:hypothetical protein FISHEDRAFT_32908 [Fistulina hepatica ATCC 64428]|uniref:Uncharacterized protein n=1 Tax=Fistulina hepatica ATCC 64428 TaxID=1128425 RepID=A0A0D7AQJ1_9AGAR|nr:hypothetical protein FISHEDRAFT_46583 [Fistulina hepatica ATCC 64428]KIY53596.1 hypothetical protein FISHEDRAFT_32908 [Fistulina hepatica ATCC 64428]